MSKVKTIIPERSVFVSYAHKDRALLEDMLVYLKALEHDYGLSLIWDDSDIQEGEAWRRKIDAYLPVSPLAILFVSPYFAASDFIRKNELPTLLNRWERGEAQLLPVVAKYCSLENLGLSHLQAVANPEKPLIELPRGKRWRVYQSVRDWIERHLDILASPSAPSQSPPVPARGTQTGVFQSIVGETMAVEEIEHQLARLIKQTRNRGYVVFSRGAYYVQFDYFKESDAHSVSIEVVSNAYLAPEFQLGKLQTRHLKDIHFMQDTPEENWRMLAAIDTGEAVGKLAFIAWHILDEVVNCPQGAGLEVEGVCW